MEHADCILMAEYNRWMNSRLYDAAAKLGVDVGVTDLLAVIPGEA